MASMLNFSDLFNYEKAPGEVEAHVDLSAFSRLTRVEGLHSCKGTEMEQGELGVQRVQRPKRSLCMNATPFLPNRRKRKAGP